MNYIFECSEGGIVWETVPEIADWLEINIEEQSAFFQSMAQLATGMGAWGDYRGERALLNHLVDIKILLAKRAGKRVLE